MREHTVIVADSGAGVRAFPGRILQNNEVLNDTLDGVGLAVTDCPLTASAVVPDPRVDGPMLTVGGDR